ncbi:NADH dehydrogenase [ubiquinone] 1 alpha subcomplex assembly factor 2 isoform X2 [Vitis riparia]|uniref:NADH dehydrogenase [ubiquinone] 1 alpha subcomplex assembly factor 2 isoform X2 n=1 Tax=Vitis riparia TaxID=96939 RepID=UPI00155B2435|nr:NADH dehydrogenase [ubiquinone] 1 alpha subcomplex assembly factor 2 isoform X2 [Vitis riparia]
MSKLLSRIAGFFSSRTMVGADKVGNRYFIRKEEVDGIIEWICWLNGQRKVAPTPEEMIELEARRERVRLNVALLKEEEERKAKEGSTRKVVKTGKVGGPDLKSFIRQFPATSEGDKMEEASDAVDDMRNPKETDTAEPTGTGASFKPGTWQPPT